MESFLQERLHLERERFIQSFDLFMKDDTGNVEDLVFVALRPSDNISLFKLPNGKYLIYHPDKYEDSNAFSYLPCSIIRPGEPCDGIGTIQTTGSSPSPHIYFQVFAKTLSPYACDDEPVDVETLFRDEHLVPVDVFHCEMGRAKVYWKGNGHKLLVDVCDIYEHKNGCCRVINEQGVCLSEFLADKRPGNNIISTDNIEAYENNIGDLFLEFPTCSLRDNYSILVIRAHDLPPLWALFPWKRFE